MASPSNAILPCMPPIMPIMPSWVWNSPAPSPMTMVKLPSQM